MAVVTFSLFGFDRLQSKLWAFSQMGLAKPSLRRIEGLKFFKLMGTGAGSGFSGRPNFGVYTLLGEWTSLTSAREQLGASPILDAYRERSARHATLFMTPVTSRGTWDGHAFERGAEPPVQKIPVVALTRASIRLSKLARFWARVPAISGAIENEDARRFMIGTGELPWIHQVTLSIWDDMEAMTRFSLSSPTHGEAVRRAYQGGWFSEYCFTRFNLIDMQGAWPGLDRTRLLEPDAGDGQGHSSRLAAE